MENLTTEVPLYIESLHQKAMPIDGMFDVRILPIEIGENEVRSELRSIGSGYQLPEGDQHLIDEAIERIKEKLCIELSFPLGALFPLSFF